MNGLSTKFFIQSTCNSSCAYTCTVFVSFECVQYVVGYKCLTTTTNTSYINIMTICDQMYNLFSLITRGEMLGFRTCKFVSNYMTNTEFAMIYHICTRANFKFKFKWQWPRWCTSQTCCKPNVN